MEFPFCKICLDNGRAVNADVVDHIVPLDQGGERLEQQNLQSLCHSCHKQKTDQDKKSPRETSTLLNVFATPSATPLNPIE
jgi:5-methylcytosine-specific restriction endonuclease McrA